MPTMGKNSPTAPAGMMSRPSGPSSMSLSRRIGSKVPERSRGQRQRHRDEGVHEAADRQQAGDHDRDHGADQPTGYGQPPAPLPKWSSSSS